MKTTVGIRVAVIFGPDRRIKPVWFELNRRKHEVKETTYKWESNAGSALLIHYTVTDGEGLYELVYNSREHTWSIEEQQPV